MKFYLISKSAEDEDIIIIEDDKKNEDNKKNQNRYIVVSEKIKAGVNPDPLHQEILIPSDFLMELPVDVLTQILKNETNEAIQKQRELSRGGIWYTTHRTPHGRRIMLNPILLKTHFDEIDGLTRLEKDHTDEYKIDGYTPQPDEKPEPGVTEGYEKVTVQRNIVEGASFETIKQALQERKIALDVNKGALVGYATYNKLPAVIFVAQSLAEAEEMLSRSILPENSTLRLMNNWTLYYTYDIGSLVQHIIDVLSEKNKLEHLHFLTKRGKRLEAETFGDPRMAIVADYFQKSNIAMDKNVLDIMASYVDDRKASVCDLLISPTAPHPDKLHDLDLTTDKAYIRTGLCEILFMKTSPRDKRIRIEETNELIEEVKAEGRTGTREELITVVQSRFITSLHSKMKHLYILTPNELFYVCDRSKPVGEEENVLVTADPYHIQILKNELRFNMPEGDTEYRYRTLSIENQDDITGMTDFTPKIKQKLYFVDRTSEACVLISATIEQIEKFDRELTVNHKVRPNRILTFAELKWIKTFIHHDYMQVIEVKDEKKEEKEIAPEEKKVAARSSADINAALKVKAKKLCAHVLMNNFGKFKAFKDSLPADESTQIDERLQAEIQTADKKLLPRLSMFQKKYKSTPAQAPVAALPKPASMASSN
jgi:hypothetical protein